MSNPFQEAAQRRPSAAASSLSSQTTSKTDVQIVQDAGWNDWNDFLTSLRSSRIYTDAKEIVLALRISADRKAQKVVEEVAARHKIDLSTLSNTSSPFPARKSQSTAIAGPSTSTRARPAAPTPESPTSFFAPSGSEPSIYAPRISGAIAPPSSFIPRPIASNPFSNNIPQPAAHASPPFTHISPTSIHKPPSLSRSSMPTFSPTTALPQATATSTFSSSHTKRNSIAPSDSISCVGQRRVPKASNILCPHGSALQNCIPESSLIGVSLIGEGLPIGLSQSQATERAAYARGERDGWTLGNKHGEDVGYGDGYDEGIEQGYFEAMEDVRKSTINMYREQKEKGFGLRAG
ncbi:hypothetical protein BT63DRAFT_323791 [Microthyrium microscopicum]|uniref:Uncharacterized protein n=1 Tax=Microthyrium microscopicum TaxID=703497 RepID=A0A6A6U3S6_9PEZI|nr:hypothetical protein BT63DRAFT_323791 [Microthyrium microscopicum]